MTSRVQAFTLTGYSAAPTQGTVTVQEFGKDERVRRALGGLGKWWGIALLAVFIPVAHFILVPSFLLYGIWQFPAPWDDESRDRRARRLPRLSRRADARAGGALAGAAAGDVSLLPSGAAAVVRDAISYQPSTIRFSRQLA